MNNSLQKEQLYTPIQVLLSDYLTVKKDVQNNVVQILKDIVQIRNDKKSLKKDQVKNKLKEKRQLLQGIKRKLSDSAKKQGQIYDICKKRIHKTINQTQKQKTQNKINKSIAMFFLQKKNFNFQKKKQEIQSNYQKTNKMNKYNLIIESQRQQDKSKFLDFIKLFDEHNENQMQENIQLNSQQEKQVCQLMSLQRSLAEQVKFSLKFQKTLDLENDVNLQCELFVKFRQISESILNGDLSKVKLFIYQNNHMISKLNSDIQFWIIICEAIQLIQKGEQNQIKAINLIRERIKKNSQKIGQVHKKQLKKVTSMFLLQKNQINIKPFLNSANQAFLKISHQIYRLPPQNKLTYLLSIGASILKAPCCQFQEKEDPSVCPLCCFDSHKLFKKIPILTRNESMLKCRINNQIMNQSNYPIYLPNGQIYSYKGLESTKQSQQKGQLKQKRSQIGEMYYCKTTDKFFSKNQCRKIFIA